MIYKYLLLQYSICSYLSNIIVRSTSSVDKLQVERVQRKFLKFCASHTRVWEAYARNLRKLLTGHRLIALLFFECFPNKLLYVKILLQVTVVVTVLDSHFHQNRIYFVISVFHHEKKLLTRQSIRIISNDCRY